MKGYLLAAGNGTRLHSLTNSLPKCLVPINGTPLLGIWLQWCERYGVDHVLVNTHAHSRNVQGFLNSYKGSVQVTMTYEPELLGSAGTLHTNRTFVENEQEFAVLYADVLTNFRFDRMLDFHRQRRAAITLGSYRVTNPSQCGILAADETGKVLEFTEKPEFPSSDTAFAGVLIGGPALLNKISSRTPSDVGFDVLPSLVGEMFTYTITDYLLDIGTIEKYNQAQQEWPGLIDDDR